MQYSLRNIDILHIAIYCDTCMYIYCKFCNILQCLLSKCCNIQSLHHKNHWTSGNLDYTLQFLTIYMGIQGVYLFFTTKIHIPI